jgi:hypothetical protein
MRQYKIGRKGAFAPRADFDWWDSGPFLPSLNVYERDYSPRDTGLIDANGLTIYSISEPAPIGFITRLPMDE